MAEGVSDAQLVKRIHQLLGSRKDLEKFTLSSITSQLERDLHCILARRARFIQKTVDDLLLSAKFADVSPAEDIELPKSSPAKKRRRTNGSVSINGKKRTSPLDKAERSAASSKMVKREVKVKKEDDNKPKRPPSGYFIFAGEKREQLRAQNLSITEVAKKTGELWKELGDEGRKPYEQKASKAMEKYNQELADWKSKGGGRGAVVKLKDPNKPKKPLSAYFFFMKEKREAVLKESPGLSLTQLSQKLGELWKTLSDAEKQVYEAKHIEDKSRYEKEMKTYVPGPGVAKRVKKPKQPKPEDGFIYDGEEESVSESESSDSGSDSSSDSDSDDSSSSSSSSSEGETDAKTTTIKKETTTTTTTIKIESAPAPVAKPTTMITDSDEKNAESHPSRTTKKRVVVGDD